MRGEIKLISSAEVYHNRVLISEVLIGYNCVLRLNHRPRLNALMGT